MFLRLSTFKNFKNITSDHLYHEMHEQSYDFFVDNILNKIIKGLLIWYALQRKTFVTIYRDLRARTYSSSVGLTFLSFAYYFSQTTTFLLILSCFCFLHLVSVDQQLFRLKLVEYIIRCHNVYWYIVWLPCASLTSRLTNRALPYFPFPPAHPSFSFVSVRKSYLFVLLLVVT